MEFGLVPFLTKKVSDYARNELVSTVVDLSNKGKEFFGERDYGSSVKGVYIGVLCQEPEFIESRDDMIGSAKYFIKEKNIELDVRLEYDIIMSANRDELEDILERSLIDSLENVDKTVEEIVESFKVKDFDLNRFREDFVSFLREQKSALLSW